MTWTSLFYVSSQDFDGDIKSLKTVFSQFEKQIHQKDGYRFSPDAEFAMGWYFYTIYVKIGFIKKLVEYNHTRDPKVKDEKAILKIVQNYLKVQKSKARVKFDRDKPTFGEYHHWLLR
jgi:hypothetical protein